MARFEGRLFIDGEFVEAASKDTFSFRATLNPQEPPVAQVSIAAAADVDRAVAGCKAAQSIWIQQSSADRAAVLTKFSELVARDAGKLGELDGVALGRPSDGFFFESEVVRRSFIASAALARFVGGRSSSPDHVSISVRQPYGVCAAIIPWNAPMVMWAAKVAPAVAAGNGIIVKTSERAPLSGAYLAKLAIEASFPKGLIQNLSGYGETGKLLAEHMQVRAISFTGSGAVGKLVQEAAARSNLKKVMLELGGKSPTLVFDDADLAIAVEYCMVMTVYNSGQVCIASSRIYVQSGIYDRFLKAFTAALKSVPPSQPLIDARAGEAVLRYLESGKKDGQVAVGGSRVEEGISSGTFVVQPTVFTDIPDDAKINREEIFGPVTNVHRFETEEEAIRRANDTEYGLWSAVFTENGSRALRVANQLEAGTVVVNSARLGGGGDMPFGGWKQSGQGAEGGYGALEEWLHTKSILIKVKSLL